MFAFTNFNAASLRIWLEWTSTIQSFWHIGKPEVHHMG